jgi:protein-tyrosine phosphatase
MNMQTFTPGELIELPFGLPGRIYRSPIPYGDLDTAGKLVARYQDESIRVIVVLADDVEIHNATGKNLRSYYQQAGYEVIHLPIPDYGIPNAADLEKAVSGALTKARSGKNVVVHCNAGIGRTGLFLACMAQDALGITSDEAIHWVRSYIPGAVETPGQLSLVQSYHGVNTC